MSTFVTAFPMYDWPETLAETDAEWSQLCHALRAEDFDAPAWLTRRNADMPAVPGGIRDAEGRLIAPDPATLPPDELDLGVLWRHPALLLAQTCWGPMEAGLDKYVQVVGQPDYSAHEGGEGQLYSSAILMRRGEAPAITASADAGARIPLEKLRGKRLAYNEPNSMSGFIALRRDLEIMGEGFSLFPEQFETGSHRASALAVAEGRADVCAVDCRTWTLILRFEPASAGLVVAGWTGRRKGLPFITSWTTPPEHLALLRRALGPFPP
ncbi:phosphate/phosphite/phosphonate ABC transporter substrate-binding protein [Chelativorans sp. YIM 93263]|uniref:phosphate/phosphite/phosphonate ABC transporter substrate-binding protein n=1 Tax=Chelativorans sp. YIM 93263 TaxID=2906648 RepID=UPI0023797791|nr:PhnD/SsuA/transferrin family substrate-binding protein [Chelativorans sp. YIM 93263]